MVQIGSTRMEGLKKPSALQWLSWFSYAAMVLICLAITSTLHVFDNSAVSRHGSLVDMAKRKPTVAFVITITGCGNPNETNGFHVTEGAAVLHHSIKQNMGGTYGYKMYAIYHPDAKECAQVLEELGYTLIECDTPVPVKDIQGDFLRERIEKNGCCGEKELIKLEAFTLTDHPVVVILDVDVLILKPLDTLFDLLLKNVPPPPGHLQWPDRPLPNETRIIYTNDYNMAAPSRKVKPVQGGFVIVKPSMTVYEEFRGIVRLGDYRDNGGWGGITGKFYGDMTFQGLMPYYLLLHPGQAIELNRCVYNNMAQNPRQKNKEGEFIECYTQQENCEDCRERPVEEIITTHFTNCQKPWLCHNNFARIIEQNLCRNLHGEWFRVRSEMEQSWGRTGWGESNWTREHFRGFCTNFGSQYYEAIQKPYGKAIELS